jgi:hypothetical protein
MAITTLKETIRRLQQRMQNDDTSSTDSFNDFIPKAKVWVNEAYNRIMRSKPWQEIIRSTSLSLVASTNQYSMNRDVAQVVDIYDTTNECPIYEIDVKDNNEFNFPATDVGDPSKFFHIGNYNAQNKLTVAEKVSFASSSSSDISPLIAQVRGLVSGVEVQEDVVLTGSSSVDSLNTYDANQIPSIHVGTNDGTTPNLVGVVTATGATSSTVLTKIAPRTIATDYVWLQFVPTPDASATQPTYTVWYRRKYPELVNDNDIPLIDCCFELIEGSYAQALREDGQTAEAQAADVKFVEMVEELWMSRQNPDKFEQFIPTNRDYPTALDFGRVR